MTRRYWALFFVTVSLVVVIGWTNDHRSCERSAAARNALNYASGYFLRRATAADERARLEPLRLAALDLQAAAEARRTAARFHVPRLSCSGLLPTVR